MSLVAGVYSRLFFVDFCSNQQMDFERILEFKGKFLEYKRKNLMFDVLNCDFC